MPGTERTASSDWVPSKRKRKQFSVTRPSQNLSLIFATIDDLSMLYILVSQNRRCVDASQREVDGVGNWFVVAITKAGKTDFP